MEVRSAGPTAVARMQRTRLIFEQLIGASFSEAPDGAELSPLLVKGIVCGIERATRQLLLAGRVRELPFLTDKLLAWALCHRSPTAPALLAASTRRESTAPSRPRPRAHNQRERILHAAAQIAARGGYAQLTAGQIAHDAGVSKEGVPSAV